MKKAPRYWKPLRRIPVEQLHRPEAVIQEAMAHYGKSRDEIVAMLNSDEDGCEYWVNHLYQVEVRRYEGGLVQLNIRRVDGSCDLRDWRHFQEIKNQLVGPECEGIELYPAESRKVDTSNKWHLWCVADPTYRFPFGWKKRDVQYEERGNVAGLKQRAL